jgi:N-acetylglucosaminyl-diphospho-decaprenol L-rhamnosyltransferase
LRTPPDLSVLIVSYNTRVLLSSCLASLHDAVGSCTYEVIVADNASSDGSVAMLRADWPEVAVVEMGGNTGFGRANNAAMARAAGRHILLLNSDTEAFPGSLEQLIQFLDEHPEAGVAAPKLLNADFTDQGTARAFPTAAAVLFGRKALLTKLFPNNPWAQRYMLRHRQSDVEPFPVDWVSGACMMVPRAVVDQVGNLDERFFMHWEDADWCRRIGDAGYGVYCVPTARVVHLEGQSERSFGGVSRPKRVGRPAKLVWIFHQSAYYYFTKHHARQPWHPLRLIAGVGLMARAAAIIAANAATNRLHSRSAPPVGRLRQQPR